MDINLAPSVVYALLAAAVLYRPLVIWIKKPSFRDFGGR